MTTDPPITELERELLILIRDLDGGYCLTRLLFGDQSDRLMEAMRLVPPEVKV